MTAARIDIRATGFWRRDATRRNSQRFQIFEQCADTGLQDARLDFSATLHWIQPARIWTEFRPEGVTAVGFARNPSVVFLDHERLVRAVARSRTSGPFEPDELLVVVQVAAKEAPGSRGWAHELAECRDRSVVQIRRLRPDAVQHVRLVAGG